MALTVMVLATSLSVPVAVSASAARPMSSRIAEAPHSAAGGTSGGFSFPVEDRPSTRSYTVSYQIYGRVRGSIQHADPDRSNHPKRFRDRVRQAIKSAIKRRTRTSGQAASAAGSARFAFFGCSFALAKFIMEYGIPIAKVWRVAREAKALYGSVSGIVQAVLDGRLAGEMGEDGADVVYALLGAGDLMDECLGV